MWFDDAVSNEKAGLTGRLNEKLQRLFVLLVVAYVIAGSFRPLMDNVDLGWHVAQGRWMVEHGSLYRHDVLNYPTAGQPIINEYPLFQVVLFGAWSLGWWGPCALTALAYALLLGVLIKAGRDLHLGASALSSVAIGLMLLFLQVAVPLRPHLASYLGIAILGVFLLRHQQVGRWTAFWPMALLQVAWGNCHSGFVIGPAMVGLFGMEVILRQAIREKTVPWQAIQTWLGAFLLILLACFVNPFGLARFYPPIFQDRLESIRAYVGEMEPLPGVIGDIYGVLVILAAGIVLLAFLRHRAISWSFLVLAGVFYVEALSTKKAWPILGLFIPLLILSTGAFIVRREELRNPVPWTSVAANFIMSAVMAMGLMNLLDRSSDLSLAATWREYNHGRSEMAWKAAEWMKAHGVDGRLYHRCEDGGCLQQSRFDQGETFADTGFGKYDETFIHEIGLGEERPALVPLFVDAYQPKYVVCGNFSYQWPYYLRQSGWRLIFYSPNSSVWARPEERPDLITVRDEEVQVAFDADLAANGRPLSSTIYGHNLIALNSMGLEDFAFTKLRALPDAVHHAPWYWEAARIFCFEAPEMSREHRDAFLSEAKGLSDDDVTAEFRAYCQQADGDTAGAQVILEKIPPPRLGNAAAELLLKIYLDQKQPKALALAQRTDCFDLRNGRHWQYLAEAEEQAGHPEAAAPAWRKAVFYYPDDATLMARASDFATRFNDAELARDLTFIHHLPGTK